MLLIDTSAIVKFFSQEEGWEQVRQYIADAMTLHMAISELGNALLFKVRKKDLSLKTATEILSKYAKNAVLLNDEEYTEPALQAAYEGGLTMYDSTFLAACMEEGFGLVTCDRTQAKEARRLGIEVTEC